MNKFIVLLTFIPWFLYFASLSKNAIYNLNKNKITLKNIKDNSFKMFQFENLILIGLFVYFSIFHYKAAQIFLVEVLLFSSINLYLFIDKYYDTKDIEYEIGNKDITTILIILILMLIPVVFYLITNKEVITYFILFGYSIFNYIIVLISKLINDKIYKIVRRHNNGIK